MSQSLRAGGLHFMRECDKGERAWWVLSPLRNNITISPLFPSRLRWRYTQSWTLAHKLYQHLLGDRLVENVVAGANGTPIDGSLLNVGDISFLGFYKHPAPLGHSQFASGRNADGEFLLAQHSGPCEKPLSEVNDRIHGANGSRWKWVIARPIHTAADIGGRPT